MSIQTLKASATANAWWAVPQLVVALALGATFGLWGLWIGYAVFNSLGVWLYCDGLPNHQRRRRRWVQGLAIPLLPVGLVCLFASSGGLTPSEASSSGSDDGSIRKATASVMPNSSHLHGTP